MVTTTRAILPFQEGNLDFNAWLAEVAAQYSEQGMDLVKRALHFAQLHSEKEPEKLLHGLEIASILRENESDYESVAASLLYPVLKIQDFDTEDLAEALSPRVYQLIHGVHQLENMETLGNSNSHVIDNLRQMLLTMIDDVRVVLIKLAERCYVMRHLSEQTAEIQQTTARKTMAIYAPLANRLGVTRIKWELEDLSFRYLQPEDYRSIAKKLILRRVDREECVNTFIDQLSTQLTALQISHRIHGRAKHIYSVYKKMQRKNLGYEEIYDVLAVRVLVDTLEDCYKTLSVVHSTWPHVPSEFDDYIATPKANGYQSIHTVAHVNEKNYIEVQIRTHSMHEKNEKGVAAHWVYKEGAKIKTGIESKIAWLRELLEWQQEFADYEQLPEHLKEGLEHDRIYVFTPQGDVISLLPGSTALDFAYHIHSNIGHRCKGAKVNGHIISLTDPLKTGDKIEIITGKHPQPSRDWMNPNAGYLQTPRARAKVHSWFRKQDLNKNVVEGQEILEHELKRLDAKTLKIEELIKKFHLNTREDLLASLGNGDIRLTQLQQSIQQLMGSEKFDPVPQTIKMKPDFVASRTGIQVEGVGDLLTHLSGCCRPIPGDPIVGYISQGRGVSIHRVDCHNALHEQQLHPERIMNVSWVEQKEAAHQVDLLIVGQEYTNLLRDVAALFSQEKIMILTMNMQSDYRSADTKIYVSLSVKSSDHLEKLITQLKQIPQVHTVTRR